MSDFAMCPGFERFSNDGKEYIRICPRSLTCWRHTAQPSTQQSYVEPPWDRTTGECELFIPNGKKP